MTRDDIIRMAREAGDVETDSRGRETFSFDCYGLERFAQLVATVERLACARICYSAAPRDGTVSTELELARAIRARSKA
jgi:hypothetical protein